MKALAILLLIIHIPVLWFWFEWREKVLAKIEKKHKDKHILEPHETRL